VNGIETPLRSLIFQESWWLAAVCADQHEQIVIEQGGNVVGRLAYLATRRGPFRVSRMPPFTHLLGPVVDAGAGKPQTRLTRRLSITRALIDKLPALAHFEQHFDPSVDEGLAAADGLAFQDRGFSIAPQYTFEIDCRKSVEELWDAMHFKTRQHIRRAEEKYTVRNLDDAAAFTACYLENIQNIGANNRMDFDVFPNLYSQCRSRQCAEILAACSADGKPVSMVYVVWSAQTMYYLLSTRGHDPSDNGSINLLIWSAMKLAHQRGLMFDLDGVYTSGTARFLSGFGGYLKTRFVVRRSRPVFSALQHLKWRYSKNESRYFT
jgi:hypothetical protein